MVGLRLHRACIAAAWLVFVIVSGCGGGGGGSSSAGPEPASLTVTGTVSGDKPLSNAAVTVFVGARSFASSTDAQGRFTASIQVGGDADFVRIEAQGSATQAAIKLQSLVGDFTALAAAAGAGNEVTSAAFARLNVNHQSTAVAALAIRANAGTRPTTGAQLDIVLARIKPAEWLDMAALIKRVVDGGVTLPGGVADTWALVNDPNAYFNFLEAAVASNDAAYAAARVETIAGLALAAPEASDVLAGQTMVYYGVDLSVVGSAYVVTYNADGTAYLRGDFGTYVATWTRDAQKITITLPSPVVQRGLSDDLDPVLQRQNEIDINETQLVIRRTPLFPRAATLVVVSTITYRDGARAGKTVTGASAGDIGDLLLAANLEQRLPIAADEFAPGRRWSGFAAQFSVSQTDIPATTLLQDAIQVGTEGAAHSLVDNTPYSFTLGDRKLSLTQNAGGINSIPIDYMRLSVDPISGEERWLALAPVVAGAGSQTGFPASISVVPFASDMSFGEADAARIWQSARDSLGRVVHSLFPDHTGEQVFTSNSSFPTQHFPTTWLLDAGRVIATRNESFGSGVRTRTWIPVARVGNSLWVFEMQASTRDGPVPTTLLQRTLRLGDLGPALK